MLEMLLISFLLLTMIENHRILVTVVSEMN